MSAKHLINSIETSVIDNLVGLVSANTGLRLIRECASVVRADYQTLCESRQVLLVSGGGSGHEPMFSGFVGPGLLSGAIAGDIFASPPARPILKLIETLTAGDRQNQMLIILANYTGDRLNFGVALERAKLKGYDAELFTFGDDCAFYGEGKTVGRRGLAGIAFVHKIAGALADEGLRVAAIKTYLTEISDSIGTISVSLSACDIPGHGSSFSIKADEIELGLGVHGEAGVATIPLRSADKVVEQMLTSLVGPVSPIRDALADSGNRIAVLVNNLGGLSPFEFNIVTKETVVQLKKLGLTIKRIYCGDFMTSFNMSGFSVSIMAVNERTLELLDAPCGSPAWTQLANAPKLFNERVMFDGIVVDEDAVDDSDAANDELQFGREKFVCAVRRSCELLISSESLLNELDKECGDADCGSTLAHTSKCVLKVIDDEKLKPSFGQLARLTERTMGGTSGAIYSLMFTAASRAVRDHQSKLGHHSYGYRHFWTDVLRDSIDTIVKYSSARPGDRSMIDALHSAYECLAASDSGLSDQQIASRVAESARNGAESTARMAANVGRASYVNASKLAKADPGAMGVAIWMSAIADVF